MLLNVRDIFEQNHSVFQYEARPVNKVKINQK